ncbi:MAG TPA: putative glycolipid-binding domain-containing protein [Mycobacteriales bacterium]|jgi:hypothetical protein|nr:putative glycolipid-binding domain-containing protein [Mycobacteriales bacterium]
MARVLTWRADPASGEERFEQARVDEDLTGFPAGGGPAAPAGGGHRYRARGTILVGAGELTEAAGVGYGGGPAGPFRVDYELDLAEAWTAHRLVVRAEGAGWRRELWLRRDADGAWTCRRVTEPDEHAPVIDDVAALDGALDCDLVSSALFNMPPIRRSGLHREPGRQQFLMAWVSIPDLAVTPSRQTYAHVRPRVVSFDSEGGFTAEIDVDDDGYATRYPSVALRV